MGSTACPDSTSLTVGLVWLRLLRSQGDLKADLWFACHNYEPSSVDLEPRLAHGAGQLVVLSSTSNKQRDLNVCHFLPTYN